MNKKLTKVLSVFLIAGALGAGVAGATGCTHKHTYDTGKWVVCKDDATKHGNPSTCKHAGLTINEEPHADTTGDGKCDKCETPVKKPDDGDKPSTNPGDTTTVTVTSVTVTATDNATSLKVEDTLQLIVAVVATPDEATNKEVNWSSSDENKATVSATGLVTGVAEGQVTITATSKKDESKKHSITLTVEAKGAVEPGPGTETPDPDKYDLVTTDVNFDDVAKEIKPDVENGNFAITADYTYKNKVTFKSTGKSRFEVGSNCFNTQGEAGTITIVLSGVQNNLTIGGKGASGNFTGYSLTKSDGSVVKEDACGNVEFSFELTNLPAGTYILTTKGGAARIKKIAIAEYLEKSNATGITVVANTVDFLKGSELSTEGLTVSLNYANGRKDALFPEDYEVTGTYEKDVAGTYTLTVTYRKNTQFTATYDVHVYTIDSMEIFTIGLSNDGKTQLTVQQAIKTGGTLTSDNLTVKGTGTLGEGESARTHTFDLPATAYTVELPNTSATGEQNATVAVKTDYTTNGAALSKTYKVLVKDAVEATNDKVEIEVGAQKEIKTLTQAVQFLKSCELSGAVQKIIKLDAGTYNEKVWIEMDNVIIIGQGTTADETKITSSLVEGDKAPNGGVWGLTCATVHVKGKNFMAHKVNISNEFDYIHNSGNYTGSQSSQGLALTLDGDGAVLSECHLYGNQDTLFMRSGRHYFKNTQIDGNVDFIFGEDTSVAYFEECTIKAINRTEIPEGQTKGSSQNGYVTAAKHDKNKKPDYGYVFYKCTMTDDGKVKDGAMSLGRSWGSKATIAYIECKFSDAYSLLASDADGKDHRWSDWSGGTKAADADFKEYGSTKLDGTTKIMETAVTGGAVIDKATADLHTKANTFGTNNGGLKTTYTTVFDCDGALTQLLAIANGQTLTEYTVTIKDTAGNVLGEPQTYTEGQTLSVAGIKDYVNNLESVKTAEKEVDKVYSAYTDATTNTELVDGLITASCEITVSLKDLTEKVYDLLGYEGGTIQFAGNSPKTGEYLGILIDTSVAGKFHKDTTNNRIQVNKGTVLKIPMTKRYGVELVPKSGSIAIKTHYSVEYITESEQLYAKVTALENIYLTSIVIDKTAEQPETQYYQVSFDLNYTGEGVTNPDPVSVISGYAVAKPADPARDGWTFNYWYAGDDDTVEYDFTTAVTGALALKAKWTEGKTVLEPTLITEAKTFNFGKMSGTRMEYVTGSKKVVDGLLIEGTTSANGDWTAIVKDTTIKLKVKAGLSVEFTLYKGASFTVAIDGTLQNITPTGEEGNKAFITVGAQATDVEITLTCTANDYVGGISVTGTATA